MNTLSALAVVFLLAADQPRALSGTGIIQAFDGKTITGAYADGVAFREAYHADGTLSYVDVRGSFVGRWSVRNNLFCTFYADIAGACFRIEKISDNCFDFFAAAESEAEALNPPNKPRYTARASVVGSPDTCPDPLQV